MEGMKAILQYFREDPARVLIFLGGSGGIAYWINLYRSRARVQIRIVEEGIYGIHMQAALHFEVENLGTTPTSLKPEVRLTGFTPHRSRRQFIFHAQSGDRNLPPSVPRQLEARTDPDTWIPPLWFKTYTFTPTRGRVRRIRMRSADGAILSYPRFLIELLRFRIFRKVHEPKKDSAS